MRNTRVFRGFDDIVLLLFSGKTAALPMLRCTLVFSSLVVHGEHVFSLTMKCTNGIQLPFQLINSIYENVRWRDETSLRSISKVALPDSSVT